MKVLDKPTPGNYPNLVADKKQAAAAAPNVDPDDVTPDKESRTTDAVQLHSEYIDLVSQGGAIDRDLLLVKMKLKTLCGQARGIDGIFEYVRADRMTFDEDSFEADNPALYAQFTVQRNPQRRFAVMPGPWGRAPGVRRPGGDGGTLVRSTVLRSGDGNRPVAGNVAPERNTARRFSQGGARKD